MHTENRRNQTIDLAQLFVWVGLMVLPALVTGTITGSLSGALPVLKGTLRLLLPWFALYVLNYYLLVPHCLHKGKALWFYLGNALYLIIWNTWHYFPRKGFAFPQEVVDQFGQQNLWLMFTGRIVLSLLIQVLIILIAVGIRRIMQSNTLQMQMEQERRKTAEAELTWLKHQLNPHFLFNTLNNISSLTQIDPDKAQESIGQLSDLLRYALYDSEAQKVDLSAEVEFMNNYIDLMALRCNELTTVSKNLVVPQGHVEVAPLLFISLVENAFKHGVNARHPSFVEVSMQYADGALNFRCRNSLFEKQGGNDHIGSGIGLENMKRRLELLYPGKYTYSQQADEDSYSVEVTLQL